MAKIVSLSVHKNTLAQRTRKRVISSLEEDVRAAKRNADLGGYILVMWDREANGTLGATDVRWCGGSDVHNGMLGEFAKRAIEREHGTLDASNAVFGRRPPEDDGA